jgi:1-deoxy-D-xylulose-5-phosphate synthase
MLRADGVDAIVVNARFVKPLDEEMVLRIAREFPVIVTVEEAYLAGGFGSAVLEVLEANGMQDKVRIVRMGVADEIVSHGDPKALLAAYGLDADGIRDRVKSSLESLSEAPSNKSRLRAVK